MPILDITPWQLLVLFQHEMLLFAGIFFLLGAIDDFAVDLVWLWLKLTGRARSKRVDGAQLATAELAGSAAIFVPTWHEAGVIRDTIAHALGAWPQDNLRLYVGCYRNDAETIAAVMSAAPGDPRLRLVIHDRPGPSTKADCLNRLYRALLEDEARTGCMARMVVFHDAEDMVDPAALKLLDEAIGSAEFVQLPVLPLPQANSRWLGSHYCEEFAEAHAKGLVVRDALGAAIPSAGVGCAASRAAVARLAEARGGDAPFEAESLTEDYEMGLRIAEQGGRCRFLRKRHLNGELIATRAYFPARLDHVVRQKTRWIHGIAFQGWDRLGWNASSGKIHLAEQWMRMRDRRGPLTALVLFTGYLLLVLSALAGLAAAIGRAPTIELTTGIKLLLAANFAAFVWRAGWRFGFTAREFGLAEGFRAVLRIPITNIIAIMAGRRALAAYVRSLAGQDVVWDKTPHFDHPSRSSPAMAPLAKATA
ncbi:glycosyl transferase family protein [Altererythrobacter sp. BO-6]|uniref:glycosyl transferase family protein n=1 Tax=Altererythrobacter sp. BO-6 TaxID=2604537 RepID=UPI001F49E99B|nr:glycosyl transferase family protein [Altererythrobacter sp. BO-6]